MTTAAEESAVEAAFEAYLAGRPVPDGGADLAAFAGAVRATATRPGRPNAALAELLVTGLPIDQPSPSARTARTRRRRRLAMFLPALLAKLLSAGAVAQAATGAGVVLVVATGAGATGVLGDDVRDTITTVVGTTAEEPEGGEPVLAEESPAATPTPAEVTTTPVATPSAGADPAAFDAAVWAEEGPAEDETFGEWVREAARAGKADGQVISRWARLKHVDVDDVEELADLGIEDLEDTATPTPTPSVAVEQADSDDSGSSARGSGNGGNGNGGNGSGGNGSGANGSGGNGKAAKGNGRN